MSEMREPEQVFFRDPALDRAVALIMTLAAELHVTKDRLRSMEVLLVERGVLEEGALDHYVPSAGERLHLAAERKALVEELMRCVKGDQVSKGPPADLMQRFG
jgi:hypothetical protein